MAWFTRRKTPETTSRIVRTSRWVHVNQLELGMYVSELDLPWSDTRFRFQGFRIESMDTLRELQRVCTNVMIVSEKLAAVPIHDLSRPCSV